MRRNTCGRAEASALPGRAASAAARATTLASSVLALAAIALTTAAGCGATCDISEEGNPPEVFTGGAVLGESYASSPWAQDMLHFPGGKQYQLVHHLGFTPGLVQIDFAFSADDERRAPCAGNSCEIRCIDDQIIWVKNDTCTEFWIAVTAFGHSPYQIARCSNDELDAGAPPVGDESADDAVALDAPGDATTD